MKQIQLKVDLPDYLVNKYGHLNQKEKEMLTAGIKQMMQDYLNSLSEDDFFKSQNRTLNEKYLDDLMNKIEYFL